VNPARLFPPVWIVRAPKVEPSGFALTCDAVALASISILKMPLDVGCGTEEYPIAALLTDLARSDLGNGLCIHEGLYFTLTRALFLRRAVRRAMSIAI
jgi:hypothetical protein